MNQLALNSRQQIKARARLIGDRLDLKNYKITDAIGTTPLTLKVGADDGGHRTYAHDLQGPDAKRRHPTDCRRAILLASCISSPQHADPCSPQFPYRDGTSDTFVRRILCMP